MKLGEALRIMDSGAQFSAQWYTADRKKGTGGKCMAILRAVKANETPWPAVGEKPITIDAKPHQVTTVGSDGGKDPRHWDNRTRNIKAVGTNNIRKLHIRLLTHLNNHKVIWGK